MQLFASISKALGTGSWQWPSAPTAYRCHASGKLATGRRNSRDCRQVRRTDSPAALQVIDVRANGSLLRRKPRIFLPTPAVLWFSVHEDVTIRHHDIRRGNAVPGTAKHDRQ